MAKKDIVVIGGSAGSHSPIRQIITDLPADLPVSVFIANHVPTHSAGYLSEVLEISSKLRVMRAADGQPIERGCVYVAIPDHHLLVVDGTIRLGNGPRENMSRPAIDPLFRSAALSYGPRVVGVVLSGMLNDGASGLWAVKACGGTAIVQYPLDALSDEMPLSALEAVQADCVAPAAELAGLIARLSSEDADEEHRCPQNLPLEVEIAAGARLGAARLREIADPSALSCPACAGVLSEVTGEHPLRYRCQIGHAYTAEILESRAKQVDEALRIALRVMEERVTLVTRMSEDARRGGRNAVADLYESRAAEYTGYAQVLREAAVTSMRAIARAGDED